MLGRDDHELRGPRAYPNDSLRPQNDTWSHRVGLTRGETVRTHFLPSIGEIAMEESLLDRALRLAPMSGAASIAYGLEHAPTFTISLLNGLLFAAVTEYHTRIEDESFVRQLHGGRTRFISATCLRSPSVTLCG